MDTEKMKKTRWLYLCTSVVLFLFLGLTYAWSVSRGPLEAEFGWSKPDTSLVFTIQITMFSVGGIISGFVTRRKGVRFSMLVSAVLIGIGFFFVSKVDSLPEIFIAYGLLFGTGVGLCYNAVLTTVVRWFPERQGMVSGIILFGYGSGAMVFGTAAAKLITMTGWRNTFIIFAVAYPALIIISSFIVRAPRQEFLDSFSSDGDEKIEPAFEEVTPGEMIRRRNYWIYEVYAVVLAAGGFAVINESTPFAQSVLGDDLTRAAAVAGIVSVFNGAGRVIFGALFDKIGYRKTMFGIVFVYALASAALLGTFYSGSQVMLTAAFVLIGTGYGGAAAMNPAFSARFFGRKNYGINYSIININPIFGAIIGPTVGSGDYLRAFIFVGIFTAIAFAAMLLMKKPEGNTSD